MDTKASVEQLGVTGNISCQSVNNLDKISAEMETKDEVVRLSLSPITPDSNKESADLMSTSTSPLTLVTSPPTTDFCSQLHLSCDDGYMNEDDDSPCTPKEGVFDPFAPGPDKLMLAPLCTKYLEESRNYVARRLNFISRTNNNDCEKCEHVSETGFEDDMLLEAVYGSLLEAIISKQAEDILADISAVDSSPNALETPPSAPHLTGIADTCPGAPLKHAKKSRNIDLSLCRKLEF